MVRVESLFQQSIRNRIFAFCRRGGELYPLRNGYGGGSRHLETGAADGHSVADVLPLHGGICQRAANVPPGPRDAVYLCERKVEEGSLPDFGIRDGYVQTRHLVGGRRARLFRGRQHRLRHRGPRPRHGRGFQGRRGLHQADQGKAEVDRLHHGHLRRGHLVHPELLFAEDLRGRSRPQFRGSRIG